VPLSHCQVGPTCRIRLPPRNRIGLGGVSASATRDLRGWLVSHAEEALNSGLRSAVVPLPNPSASRHVVLTEKRCQDLRRKHPAAATHLHLRKLPTELPIVLASSPSLLSRVFMLSALCLTSPNFSQRPSSAILHRERAPISPQHRFCPR